MKPKKLPTENPDVNQLRLAPAQADGDEEKTMNTVLDSPSDPADAAEAAAEAAADDAAAEADPVPDDPARRAFTELVREAHALRALYPALDLAQMLTEPDSRRALQALQIAGVPEPVRTVYEARHRDEILAGLAQAARRESMRRVAASVAANGARPAENGMHPTPVASEVDVKHLSRAQRDEIRKRVRAGEKITF